ncbi:radical SAM domain-containing protein [Toxoplasma gondii ME49]|uniref:Radical SAM domain-containing protein n=1 Tax=Toxoplasma gondii (strain ATCC 50611 / Me49) TaxID=508771 RepID=S8F319_TOXGM|nr:radical SAM domain-containing protein [Toxoplasma gondii ME49]EPT27868.1 radical SAM domain-containing protein [Toxoplasma gondii ME49]|eukprot:XP_018636369.1 radical SAM domain-containing protein [Toxoplasma gondii ME49]
MGCHWQKRFRPRVNPLQAAVQSCRPYFDRSTSSSRPVVNVVRENRNATFCVKRSPDVSTNGLYTEGSARLALTQRSPCAAAGNREAIQAESSESTHPTPAQSGTKHLPEIFPRAVYIHMPFCVKRCHFCAFPVTLLPATPRRPPHSLHCAPESQCRTGVSCSFSMKHNFGSHSAGSAPISPNTSPADLMELYVEVLCEEIAYSLRGWSSGASEQDRYSWLVPVQRNLHAIRASRDHQHDRGSLPFHSTPGEAPASGHSKTSSRRGHLWGASGEFSETLFRSIYFGGGTPSLIPPRLLRRVLTVLEAEAHSLERASTRRIPPSAASCRGRANREAGCSGSDDGKGSLSQSDELTQHSLHEMDSTGIRASRLCDELTIEIDPNTVHSKEYLEELADLGVTRFSVGVQSFDDDILKRLGRSNDRAGNVRVLQCLRDLVREYERRGKRLLVSTDILLSFQRRDQLLEDLRMCVELGTSHISLYGLQVEKRSAFGRTLPHGLLLDDEAAELLTEAHNWLVDRGFEHYEISSFARIEKHNDDSCFVGDTCDNASKRPKMDPDYRCLHHEAYWRSEPFFGFGMGAASFVNLHRWTRPDRLEAYVKWVRGPLSRDGFFASTSTPTVLYKDPWRNQSENRRRDADAGGARFGDGADVNMESKHADPKTNSNSKLHSGISEPQQQCSMPSSPDTPFTRWSMTHTDQSKVETNCQTGNESISGPEPDAGQQRAPDSRFASASLRMPRCNPVGRLLQQIHYRLAIEAIVSALRTSEGVDLSAVAEVGRMVRFSEPEPKLCRGSEEAVGVTRHAGELLLRGVTEGVRTALLVGTADIVVSVVHKGRPDKECLIEHKLHLEMNQLRHRTAGDQKLDADEGGIRPIRLSNVACLEAATNPEKPQSLLITTDGEPTQTKNSELNTGSVSLQDLSSRMASRLQCVDSVLNTIRAKLLREPSQHAKNAVTTSETVRPGSDLLSARLHLRAPVGFLISNDILSDILCTIDEYEKSERFSTEAAALCETQQ